MLGADPQHTDRAWRERVGVVLQSSSLYPNLTVRESLALFGGYYEHPRPVDDVIAVAGLQEKAEVIVRKLSGGQRRRLDFGLALIGDPDVRLLMPSTREAWLDEPSRGIPLNRLTAFNQKVAGALHRNGVPIMAGTDALGLPLVAPSNSLHRELQYHEKIGDLLLGTLA